MDRILSYVMKQRDGNLHDKGISAITPKWDAKEGPQYAANKVADRTSSSHLRSKSESVLQRPFSPAHHDGTQEPHLQ
jgi:hypothetical protein